MERDAKISGSSDVPSATFTLVTATGYGAGAGAAAAATATVDPTATKATSLPQPFDTTIGSNFTTGSGCPLFFNKFLNEPQFQQCYPFSLLLQVRIDSATFVIFLWLIQICRHLTISLKRRRVMFEQRYHWMLDAMPTLQNAMPI